MEHIYILKKTSATWNVSKISGEHIHPHKTSAAWSVSNKSGAHIHPHKTSAAWSVSNKKYISLQNISKYKTYQKTKHIKYKISYMFDMFSNWIIDIFCWYVLIW